MKTFSCPLVSVLFTLEPGLQFSGIRNFDSCSQCTSISSKIDMDPPSAVGRYLGCEHVVTEKVQLSPEHHPFAHVFKPNLSASDILGGVPMSAGRLRGLEA